MKRSAIDHPKTMRLAKLLKLERWGAIGILEMLTQFTARHAIRGDIGRWSDEEIADGIGWTSDPKTLIAALIAAGFLDQHPTFRLVVHDWHEHADDSTKKVLRNKGLVFATTISSTERPTYGNFGDLGQNNHRVLNHYQNENDTESTNNQISQTSCEISDNVSLQERPTYVIPEDSGIFRKIPESFPPSHSQSHSQSQSQSHSQSQAIGSSEGFRIDPNFDPAVPAAWEALVAVHREARPGVAAPTLTAHRRHSLWRALREDGLTVDDLSLGFRWCLTSPRSAGIRSRWRGIDTFLRPEHCVGYCESAKAPDAWEPPCDDDSEERIEAALRRMGDNEVAP